MKKFCVKLSELSQKRVDEFILVAIVSSLLSTMLVGNYCIIVLLLWIGLLGCAAIGFKIREKADSNTDDCENN